MKRSTANIFCIFALTSALCIGVQLTLPQNTHSQLQPKDNDSLDITIEFDYSPSSVSLELNQNTFIKTSIDGFQIVPNPLYQSS
ncbi:MAG: hypothetical protein H7A34_06025 [bacterium]|nr:hypothetical protein [bacterium]